MDKITEYILKNSYLEKSNFNKSRNKVNTNDISSFNVCLENAIRDLTDTVALSNCGYFGHTDDFHKVYKYDKNMIKRIEKAYGSDCNNCYKYF